MQGSGRLLLLALLPALLLVPAPVEAQLLPLRSTHDIVQDTTVRAHPFPESLIPAMLGAAAGSLAGVLAGGSLGWGGGDDPGLTGALVFGTLGGGAGSVLFAGPLLHRPVTLRRTLLAMTVGPVAGLVTAGLLSHATDSGAVAYFGYCLGQGAVTAGILSSSR